MTSTSPLQPPRRLRWWNVVRNTIVSLFVCWHLLFLFLSNTTIRAGWIDATIGKYESYTSLDQQWGMFTSPLWRTLPFPAVKIEFADGSPPVVIASRNQPKDMTHFFRIGGTRQRKLEHTLITRKLADYEKPIQRRYAESLVKHWRNENPSDPRSPVRVALLRCDFKIPQPGQRWEPQPEPLEPEVIATFELEQP